MPDYKDSNDNLYWLDDAKDASVLPSDCVEITPEEAATIRQNAIDNAPAVVPEVITMSQAQLALLQDSSLQTVLDWVANLPSVDGGDEARILLSTNANVRRDHTLVAGIQALLSKTDTEMDDLFILASTL